MKKLVFAIIILISTIGVKALAQTPEPPIIIIGASFGNGNTPLNDAGIGPLGGVKVNIGSYLSLGDAIIRSRLTEGFVVNEAEAGATTFARPGYFGDVQLPVGWRSYDEQLTRALTRVAAVDPSTGQVLFYNAEYGIIEIPNDCLHSAAFTIAPSQTVPCGTNDFNDTIDNLIAVGQRMLNLGITPVYTLLPPYDEIDLSITQALFGFLWVIDENSYQSYAYLYENRLETELPDALVVDAWANGPFRPYEHLGDGLHPTPEITMRAALRNILAIKNHQQQ